MADYVPPGAYLYGVVMVDDEEKPPGSELLPSPEEMKAILVGPPDCPECGRPLLAGQISNDLNITGVSMTEQGMAVEGYHKPEKMWWCRECRGVCVSVQDDALWESIRAKQDKEMADARP
jgi:hypothetical protein